MSMHRFPLAGQASEPLGVERGERFEQARRHADDDLVAVERDVLLERRDRAAHAPCDQRIGTAVDANADHGERRACASATRLDQDAAKLGAVDHKVVRPFERRAHGAE